MKKILSLLLIFGALVVSGCSCAQRGEYEFHSIRVKVGDEEKVYACSDADKLNPLVAQTCLAYDDTEIKLAKTPCIPFLKSEFLSASSSNIFILLVYPSFSFSVSTKNFNLDSFILYSD